MGADFPTFKQRVIFSYIVKMLQTFCSYKNGRWESKNGVTLALLPEYQNIDLLSL